VGWWSDHGLFLLYDILDGRNGVMSFEGGDRKRNVVISDHLPTALLEGATKAEAAATRRARRNRERILLGIVVIS
jgi:hypothetical protein